MTTITDSFTRADSVTLGTSAEGWSWTEVSGSIDIVSNKASTTAASSARAESDLSSADHYAQAVVAASDESGEGFSGLCARYAAAADTFYMTDARWQTNTQRLFKCVAGSFTSLASDASVTFNSGTTYTVKMEANGTTLTGYTDGVSKITATDSSISGNTRTGIRGDKQGGGSVTWDDFQAADLAAGGGGDTNARLIGGDLLQPLGFGRLVC